MGFVFFCRDATQCPVLVATTALQRKLRQHQPVLVNVSLGGFIYCIFSVFVVFISSCYGYFIFGRHVCALEAFWAVQQVLAAGGSWRDGRILLQDGSQGPGCWVRMDR